MWRAARGTERGERLSVGPSVTVAKRGPRPVQMLLSCARLCDVWRVEACSPASQRCGPVSRVLPRVSHGRSARRRRRTCDCGAESAAAGQRPARGRVGATSQSDPDRGATHSLSGRRSRTLWSRCQTREELGRHAFRTASACLCEREFTQRFVCQHRSNLFLIADLSLRCRAKAPTAIPPQHPVVVSHQSTIHPWLPSCSSWQAACCSRRRATASHPSPSSRRSRRASSGVQE